MSKIVLITGAGSGFGALSARQLALAGHTVYAGIRETTGRNAARVVDAADFAQASGVDLRTVELDISSQPSCDAGIVRILHETDRLDVVVHNAGHMVLGPAEAFTPEDLAHVYDVNVLGTQRVNRAALPKLRSQGDGLLLWVGSTSTRGGTPPFLAPYFAAKAAMDALAVRLRRGDHQVRHRHHHCRARSVHPRNEPLRWLRPAVGHRPGCGVRRAVRPARRGDPRTPGSTRAGGRRRR